MARLTLICKGVLVLGIWFAAGACGFSLLAQQPQPPSKNPGGQPKTPPGKGNPNPNPNPGNPGQNNNNGGNVSPYAPKVYTFPSYTTYLGGGGFFQNAGNPSSVVPGSFASYPNYLTPGFQPNQMSPYPAYFNNPTLANAGIPWNQYNFTNPYIMQPNAMNPFMNPMMNPMMSNPMMMNPMMNPYINPMMNFNTNPFGNMQPGLNPFMQQGMIGMQPGIAPVVGVGFAGNNVGVGVGNNFGGMPFNPALGFRP